MKLLLPAFAIGVGLVFSLTVAWILGESPLHVARVIVTGALGSPTQIGYSLYYATPFLFTGLSVAWAFRAGLFNIGAEGQMTLAGVAVAAVGITLPGLPWLVALPLSVFAAFLVGGAWGALAGWIKAKRGCHEVLSTILLNFIAYGLASFFILGVFKNPDSQVPETAEVGIGYRVPSMSFLGGLSPLNWSFVFALLVVTLYGFIFSKTRLGFYQSLTGGAPEVGRRAGLNIDIQTILAMFFAGGLAGLGALSPVLGFAMKTREGFAANAGFVGIAVALLGQNSAIGIGLAALLFGLLTKGALDLDLDTDRVSRDLATVIQALIVLSVASVGGLSSFLSRWKRGAR